MDGQVTLGYWGIRGLAERVRMLLEYVGLPYQQKIYTSTDRDAWFLQDKPNLLLKNPAVNLPFLLDADCVVSETDAVVVHVLHRAKRTDLLGRDAGQQVRVATAMGVIRDLHGNYYGLTYGSQHGDLPFEEATATALEAFKP